MSILLHIRIGVDDRRGFGGCGVLICWSKGDEGRKPEAPALREGFIQLMGGRSVLRGFSALLEPWIQTDALIRGIVVPLVHVQRCLGLMYTSPAAACRLTADRVWPGMC